MLFKTKWGIGKHNGMWHVFEEELFLFFSIDVRYIDTGRIDNTWYSPNISTGFGTREEAIEYAKERQEYRKHKDKSEREEYTSWMYID